MSMVMTKKSTTKAQRHEDSQIVYCKVAKTQRFFPSYCFVLLQLSNKKQELCDFATLWQKNKNLSLQHDISNWRNWFSGRTFIASFN